MGEGKEELARTDSQMKLEQRKAGTEEDGDESFQFFFLLDYSSIPFQYVPEPGPRQLAWFGKYRLGMEVSTASEV